MMSFGYCISSRRLRWQTSGTRGGCRHVRLHRQAHGGNMESVISYHVCASKRARCREAVGVASSTATTAAATANRRPTVWFKLFQSGLLFHFSLLPRSPLHFLVLLRGKGWCRVLSAFLRGRRHVDVFLLASLWLCP